jgi:hypothetical protein
MGSRPAETALLALDDGISRHTRCGFTTFEMATLSPGDSPQRNNTLVDDANAFLTVLRDPDGHMIVLTQMKRWPSG